MPVKVLELHHVGFGVNHAQADAMLDFYRDVLSLPQDPARWKIPGIYGSWINLPNGTQLHILGSEGPSRYAKGPGQDPVSNHIALAVEDVLAAEQELIARGIAYLTLDNVASPSLKPVSYTHLRRGARGVTPSRREGMSVFLPSGSDGQPSRGCALQMLPDLRQDALQGRAVRFVQAIHQRRAHCPERR